MKKPVRVSQKSEGYYEPQLALCDLVLPAGVEWTPQVAGWMVIRVNSGVGYFMHLRLNHELKAGMVLLLSEQVQSCIRASQVGELRLQYFRAEPGKLTGLLSVSEQKFLRSAATDQKLWLRILQPDTPVSEQFKKLAPKEAGKSLIARAQLLLLFLEAFGGSFDQPHADEAASLDASARLKSLLEEMSLAELIDLGFTELVKRTGCSPRHASRLFTELVGVSFREKQVELRLERACELLASTDYKVVDVALESGYQSTSLFNLIFKQRYGLSPAKWRNEIKHRKTEKEPGRRLRVAA